MALTSDTKRRIGIACASTAAASEIERTIGSAGLSANGIAARTASGTVAARTITGTANQITVVNGDGVAGNPTLSLPASPDVTTSYKVAGTKVVGAQGAAVTGLTVNFTASNPNIVPNNSVTFANGSAPTVAELLEAVMELKAVQDALIDRLHTHGLIA